MKRLEPAGEMTHRVKVNGREEDLRVLLARFEGQTIGILDDAAWPVGMADRLVEVQVPVRGRVVDEKGVGISGALVGIAPHGPFVPTWPDGSFRFPACPWGAWGAIDLQVTLGDDVIASPRVDWTAPGREEHVLKAKRPRTSVVWISPARKAELEALRVTEQAKRHARRELAEGRPILIPDAMLDDGGDWTTAYYAYDVATGDVTAVTEDGLHGAWTVPPDKRKRIVDSLIEDLLKSKGQFGGIAVLHMYRGALMAWWVYSSYRVGAMQHQETILRMLQEMDDWEEKTNIFQGVEDLTHDKVREKLADLVGELIPNVDGDAAKLSFKLGWLAATLGLSKMLEDAK